MQRKVFIAINLDKAAKQYIAKKIKPFEEELKGKWVSQDNLHLTILYIGYVDDHEMATCCISLRKALSNVESFDLEFNSIGWGPSEHKKKMIWIKGKENNNLIDLREVVEAAIKKTEQQYIKFNPHITCARINKRETLKADSELFKKEQENISFSIAVRSVDVMESLYERGNSIYKPLDIIELK